MILIEGLNDIRDEISNNIDKGQLGTDSTAPTEADTDLNTADANTIQDLTVTTTDKQVKYTYSLPTTAGTTTTYREFKVYDNSASVDYQRIVFTGRSFTTNGTKEIEISGGFFIRQS